MTDQWDAQRERSTPFMLLLLMRCALFFGRGPMRLVLWPIVAYFLCTSPDNVRASRQALRIFTDRPVRWLDVARHFHCYAACALDRIYLLCGRALALDIRADQPPEVIELAQRGGCVLLVSHVGSVEALRTVRAADHQVQLSMLVDRQAGRMFFELIRRINPSLSDHIIDAAQRGPQLVLALRDALDAGRVVAIAADRARAGERTVAVEFAGRQALLPEGPWALAAACKAPILLGVCLYHGGRRYSAHFEVFRDRLELPRERRAEALREVVQAYARRLEHFTRLAPYNWFNFYDYWQAEPQTPPADVPTPR